MRLQKIFLALTFLFICLQSSFGQQEPKAELIDEFGEANCEEFWARFDGFFSLLQNDPASTGYIIIYGKTNPLPANLKYERLTEGIVRFRNLDRNRLVIVRGAVRESVHIEFWKVPAGAEIPLFVEGNLDLSYKHNKPFVFKSYSEGDGICPTNTSVKLFADLLTANPNTRAHIVITGKTNKSFVNTEKNLLNQLVNEHSISPGRVKFFHVTDKSYMDKFDDLEYWLIPQKKK